jgi:histidyl-tRNA synthetase
MRHELVRGTYDILPADIGWWQLAEDAVREIARRYNYHEIRFPILEHTELFTRGIGETTDVVDKQMYTFPDRKGRSLTLRPEGTASIARAYLTHGLQAKDPFQKWFYIGPMFRYEKPQKGRSRQFHQYGVEAIGSLDPGLDVEVISFAWSLMEDLGLEELSLLLNSIGCSEDRARYREALRAHFAPSIETMCPDCGRRYNENPLRILDCREERCQAHIDHAPGSVDSLCSECAEHFADVKRRLDLLELPYEVNSRLVRGLDYYTRTVFELISGDLGAQDSLLGGGRYDDLIEAVGGPSTPAVGFAGGFERLVLVLQQKRGAPPQIPPIDLFVVTLGAAGLEMATRLAESLRRRGMCVDFDHRHRGLRKQLDRANRLNARYLLVLGDDEAETNVGKLKEMATGREEPIGLTAETLVERLLNGPGGEEGA